MSILDLNLMIEYRLKINGAKLMNYEQIFKNIDDILWKEAGCSNELDYEEQTSWILFLKYLDNLEDERSDEMELQGTVYSAGIYRTSYGKLAGTYKA